MTLLHRRLLYISFIIIFIITGGILLFYLQGYRLNTSDWQIKRTGALQVESLPKEAKIYLNDRLWPETTPTTLLSLSPGDYKIELQLDGFQSWSKILRVNPKEVTFTGNVRLWLETKEATPIMTTAAPIVNSWLAPNGENLLYLTKSNGGNELWLLNLKSGQTRLIARHANTEVVEAEWSESSRDIIIQEDNKQTYQWRIFNLEANLWEEITPPANSSLSAIHWGEDRHLVYGATATELYEINLRTQTAKLIWRERLIDFRLHAGLIFALVKQGNTAVELKLLKLSNLKQVPLLENPPLSTNIKFATTNKNWLPLLDIDRHQLYLLASPLSEEKPVRLLPDITTFYWTTDRNLITTNNFEIWQYNVTEDTLTFIERLSSILAGAQKYGPEPYLIFWSGNEIWALETDNRDRRQRWLIGTLTEEIRGVFLSPDYKTLTAQTANNLYRFNLTR